MTSWSGDRWNEDGGSFWYIAPCRNWPTLQRQLLPPSITRAMRPVDLSSCWLRQQVPLKRPLISARLIIPEHKSSLYLPSWKLNYRLMVGKVYNNVLRNWNYKCTRAVRRWLLTAETRVESQATRSLRFMVEECGRIGGILARFIWGLRLWRTKQ